MTCYRDNSYGISTLMSTFKLQNLDKGSEDKSFPLHLSICSESIFIFLMEFASTPFQNIFRNNLFLFYSVHCSTKQLVFRVCNPSGEVVNDRNNKKISTNKCDLGFPFLFWNQNLASKLADRCPC